MVPVTLQMRLIHLTKQEHEIEIIMQRFLTKPKVKKLSVSGIFLLNQIWTIFLDSCLTLAGLAKSFYDCLVLFLHIFFRNSKLFK